MASNKAMWTGRVISWVASALFIFSAVGKFVGGPQVDEGFEHLGLPMATRIPLGLLELAVTIVYLIPKTAALGAVLLTGYMGGAILTHWRVGDMMILPLLIGMLVWLGIYLREDRLHALLPLRK
jgi:hypothetical protein